MTALPSPPPLTDGPVLLHVEDGVARVTLNRPDRLNAFAGDMRDRLASAVTAAGEHPEVRVIVLAGAGRAFCAGADVDAMRELVERDDPETFAGLVRAGMRVVRAVRAVPQPVVAAVHGVAVGAGASLAIACDLRVASASASIGFTFNRIGLHPDWGASFFLPRLVGHGRAAELVLSGRIVEAQEAERLGLFDRVLPAERFDEEVAALAGELAGRAPRALALAKRTLQADAAPALEEAMQREAEAQLALFRTADLREGLAALRERRPPRFQGR